MILIILPNQLFETKYLPKDIDEIIILEEPVYFGYRDIKLNFNKLKLVLHRSSMKLYYDYLKEKTEIKITYIDFDLNYKLKENSYVMFKPYDNYLENKLKKNKITYLENPNFILNEEELDIFRKKNKQNKQSIFYKFIKTKLDILINVPSLDKLNQNKLSKNTIIPKLEKIKDNSNKYLLEAKKYINQKFPNNIGSVENFIYPISYKSSLVWLDNFIKNKLKNFGIYQDSIVKDEPFLFHSIISPMLNIGLLMPLDIINKVTKYYNNNKIKINNYEGFIRQIIGWREYQRYIYIYEYDNLIKSNIFNNKNKIDIKFYKGTTGIELLDDTIKSAFKYGYLHHILRLMVMSNIFNLCEINPNEVYKWFMEFSCDSYDWIMIMNVYGMGLWSSGNLTMNKPYICSSNYYLKMSNYKKGEWCNIIDALYYNFINKNKQILIKTPYKNSINYYTKLDIAKKKNISKLVNEFI